MGLRELRPDPTAGSYEPQPSRLKPILARQAVALLLVVVVVGSVGVLRYAPLTLGAGDAEVEGATAEQVQADPRVYRVGFSPRGTFTYRFSIRNAGRFGVTVRDVQPPAHRTFAGVEVLLAGAGGRTEPLLPFALAPGDSRAVIVRVSFGECIGPAPAGNRETWSSETVRYALFALPRSSLLDLPMTIRIDTAGAPACLG